MLDLLKTLPDQTVYKFFKSIYSVYSSDLYLLFFHSQVDAVSTGFLAEDSKEVIMPPDQVDGSNTVTSTLTVQEYFAKCMTKLKKTQQCTKVEPGNSPPVVVETLECLESQTKKKKKKYKHAQDVAGEPKIICTGILDSSRDEVDTQKKKKRKKSKHLDTSNDLIYNESQIDYQKAIQCSFETSKEENNDLGEQKSKRRKKSKKSRLGCN